MLAIRNLPFFALAIFSSEILFGQPNASPRITDPSFKFEANHTLLSVKVKDAHALEREYGDKIRIIYTHSSSNSFLISANHKNIFNQLKSDPNILFLDSHRKPVEEATLDYSNLSFNRISKVHQLMPALNGTSQKISIKEQSFDPTDIDLANRSFTTTVTPSTVSQHATTMAILITGAGNSSYHTLGVAPQANFTSSDFNNLFPDDISIFNSNQIHTQNHSYGVGIENYYGNEAQAYDKQVSDNPTLLHLFSVGNSGTSQPMAGSYQGLNFANLTGNFKQAKNVLVVNAVDTTLSINELNSRGPAFDGRLKPELTAYGQGGTSEAAAIVSGISSLVQQKYFEFKNELPDASMVKSILIASADDIGAKGIDFLYGYGNVNAYKALSLIDQNNFFKATLASNDEVILPIIISSSGSQLKLAVVWSDPAAAVNASAVLVNDIDASLEDGISIYLPWVLNTFPKSDSLLLPAKRKEDHLNNVEYITLDNPSVGTYQLKLKSNSLSTSNQIVSIAYWVDDQNNFSWDFPLSKDIAEAGGKNLLVWESHSGQPGDLYLQLNQSNWNLIKQNIDLSQHVYWTSPDTLAKARFKMVIGAEEFLTEEFLVSPMIQMKTAFNCADSIGLTWNKLKGEDNYALYTMGSMYLQNIATTLDTVFVLQKSHDKYFSVAPLLSGIEGLKSVTVDYSQQGSFCFLDFFSAIRFNAEQVKVQLSIGTWHQIDHIYLFKTSGGLKEVFQTILPKNQLSFEFIDDQLVAGVMTYQAEIVFKNGSRILSDEVDIPIEEKGKAILYPNPVTSDSDLNIISEGGGATFRILDLFGRIIFETELNLVMDSIDVLTLPSGFYIYQLLTAGKVTDAGRLVKF